MGNTHTPIAMRCNQEQFDKIKSIINHTSVYSFYKLPYLTNDWIDSKMVSNISKEYVCEYRGDFIVHEEWNEQIFLEACGIETEKQMKITKDQIIALKENALKCKTSTIVENLKEWFPEVFKSELIVGKWYKKNKSICFIEDHLEDVDFVGYGFTHSGKWIKPGSDNWTVDNSGWEEATNEEVFEALKGEAVRRGFKEGVWVNCLSGIKTHCTTGVFVLGGSSSLHYKGAMIFKDGVWAEIIQTITKAEAEKLLNKKII